MPKSKALSAWDELNHRQQIYLKVIYEQDQVNEEAHRTQSARIWSSTPARTWRRLDFNGRYSRIAPVLRTHEVYDPGAGATLAALRERGLIESETWTGLLTDPVYVWITRDGRAAARAGLGLQTTRVSKPRWALSEWLWREMVKVARTGEAGLTRGGFHPRAGLADRAHLYLVKGYDRPGNRPYLDASRYRWVTYDAKVSLYGTETYKKSEPVYYYAFTDEGRAHYVEHLAQYRELYPDIDAPDLQDPHGQQSEQQDGAPEAADE